jgi:transcriptional regulator with XRE-family HTH domain
MVKTILAVQCKMARVALGLGVRELAALAAVSQDTISRLERGAPLMPRTLDAVIAAFEAAGIEFTNGDEPGVKLRKKGKRK